MKLLVDVDGVISEYQFDKIVKSFFGVDLSPLAIYAYDLADVLGVSNLAIDLMFKEQVYGKPTFIENAIETLTEWKSKGFEILIHSNRVKYMGIMRLFFWLRRYKIPFSGIDMNGQTVYDFHIDDSPAKLMNTNSKTKLLFSQPWNRQCLNVKNELVRVESWSEIRRLVDGL